MHGGYEYEGWIAFDPSAPPRPVVLVFPNYAGLKQFDIDQAVCVKKSNFLQNPFCCLQFILLHPLILWSLSIGVVNNTCRYLAKCGYVGVAVDLYKSTDAYPRTLRNPVDKDPDRGKYVWLRSTREWTRSIAFIRVLHQRGDVIDRQPLRRKLYLLLI